MNKANRICVLTLVLAAVVVSGCGMKVIVTNQTKNVVEVDYWTQGVTKVGTTMEPGDEWVTRVKFEEDMLPAPFKFTVNGAEPDEAHAIITIRKPYSELNVKVKPDEEYGMVIEFYDDKGRMIKPASSSVPSQ